MFPYLQYTKNKNVIHLNKQIQNTKRLTKSDVHYQMNFKNPDKFLIFSISKILRLFSFFFK